MRKRLIAIMILALMLAGCGSQLTKADRLTHYECWSGQDGRDLLFFQRGGSGSEKCFTDGGSTVTTHRLEWSIADDVLTLIVYDGVGDEYTLYDIMLGDDRLTLRNRDDNVETVYFPLEHAPTE